MSYKLLVLAIKQPPTLSNTLPRQANANLVCLKRHDVMLANLKDFVHSVWTFSPCIWHDDNVVGVES